MSKVQLSRPTVIMLYGYPGAGKTYFSRQLAEGVNLAHLQGDRIRDELFARPKYDKQEADIITHLMEYMTEEFLNSGVSVIFDINAMRLVQRRAVRDIARQTQAHVLLIWLQTDPDSAYARISKRDRRRSDDKYARSFTVAEFADYARHMQNPQNEEYMVISGKHPFNTQRNAIMKKLYELNLLPSPQDYTNNVAKPGLVNLVPQPAPKAGRVDMSRRNIVIR